MRDIVTTIQAEQYELMETTASTDNSLTVQGAPGTGKTAVALHRVSSLLPGHREPTHPPQDRAHPHRTQRPFFMDYVSQVLPALGEEAVEQRAVGELLDGVEATREEAPDVARLKADARLLEVVRRAVDAGVTRAPEALVLLVDGAMISVEEEDVAGLLDEALEREEGLRPAKERFRNLLLRRFYDALPAAARQLGLPRLRRRRGGAAPRRLPHALPRRRAAAAEARRGGAPAAHLAGGARGARRTGSSTAPSSACSCATALAARPTSSGASTTCRCSTRRARSSTGGPTGTAT